MTRILDGVKIIDFTQGHTGSYGTMLLADFGAEVIKIERGCSQKQLSKKRKRQCVSCIYESWKAKCVC